MQHTFLARLALLLGLSVVATAQWTVEPPAPALADTIKDCTNWFVVPAGQTTACQSIATAHAITLAQFSVYNPSTKTTCNLIVGNAYCIEENWGIPPTVSTTSAGPTTTSAGNGVNTPTPIQTGMTKSCKTFHFVVTGDECGNIATKYGISTANFYSWNPAVGAGCATLWVNTYVCVGLIGGTTTTKPPASTTTGNGISTPTPILPGIVANCDQFHLVKTGDTCAIIQAARGVTAANFVKWNPGVKTDCTGLWLGYYVCFSIVGQTPVITTTTKPTTTVGNGISTPTPVLPGIVGNCDQFHLVKTGDTCAIIQAGRGVTAANFLKWNPGVKADCSGLWLAYYVCFSIVGQTPTITTTKKPTTTVGNGISTPTPILAGMVKNCDQFHLVKTGDTCAKIQTGRKVTAANLLKWNPGVKADCKGLWLGYYICFSIIGQTPAR